MFRVLKAQLLFVPCFIGKEVFAFSPSFNGAIKTLNIKTKCPPKCLLFCLLLSSICTPLLKYNPKLAGGPRQRLHMLMYTYLYEDQKAILGAFCCSPLDYFFKIICYWYYKGMTLFCMYMCTLCMWPVTSQTKKEHQIPRNWNFGWCELYCRS